MLHLPRGGAEMDPMSAGYTTRNRLVQYWQDWDKRTSSRRIAWLAVGASFLSGAYTDAGIDHVIYGRGGWISDFIFGFGFLAVAARWAISLAARSTDNLARIGGSNINSPKS
jgi:hypothetical protein